MLWSKLHEYISARDGCFKVFDSREEGILCMMMTLSEMINSNCKDKREPDWAKFPRVPLQKKDRQAPRRGSAVGR